MGQAASDQLTRLDMADFFDKVYEAKTYSTVTGEVPTIEVSRKIIDHFNRGPSIEGFNRTGYFIYDGVKVCEVGHLEEAKMRDRVPADELVSGASASK